MYSAYSDLLKIPKGILLYGEPGCGKTMIAKALAKESNSTFLNIRMSTLLNMYLGESEKTVKAIFSVAKENQPCIIFIDEIDSLTRSRSNSDNEAMSSIKSELLSAWDGLLERGDQIVVLGATNRPQDIDPAFKRRMPLQFHVGLPCTKQRIQILKLILNSSKHELEEKHFAEIANLTEDYSGSDLKELCRQALMIAVKDHLRPVVLTDFVNAQNKY